MPVFPLESFPDAAGRFTLSPEQGHHIHRVLRIQAGQNFEVSLPDGTRGRARLLKAGEAWSGLWLPESARPGLPVLSAWLGIGLLKMSRLEWLAEKCAELGLERLLLLPMQQGRVSKSESISISKINRLNKIIQETLKQCERNASIRVDTPDSFPEFLRLVADEAADAQKILLRERSRAPLLPLVLNAGQGRRVLLVGPEGGFSAEEVQLADEAGFTAASLGPALLRSETAAFAALTCLHLHDAAEGGES